MHSNHLRFFCSTGVAYLLQPSRGGALERFVARARGGGAQGPRWDVAEEAIAGGEVDQQPEENKENDRLRLLQVRLVQSGEGGSGTGTGRDSDANVNT